MSWSETCVIAEVTPLKIFEGTVFEIGSWRFCFHPETRS
jgi:hypothetical protein